MVSKVHWDSLCLAPGEFVQKILKNQRSDILYQAEYGRLPIFFYMHIEHQKNSIENMAYRNFIYITEIWELFRQQYPDQKLPLVHSTVIFQGPKKWNAPLSLHEYLGVPRELRKSVPQFRYQLLDLSSSDLDELRVKAYTRLMLTALKCVDSPDFLKIFNEKIDPLAQVLQESETGLEFIQDMLYYFSVASPYFNQEFIVQNIENSKTPHSIKEKIMTLAEEVREETIIETLANLLRIRFHEKTEACLPQLKELTPTSLKKIEERIFFAQDLETLFQGLEKKQMKE